MASTRTIWLRYLVNVDLDFEMREMPIVTLKKMTARPRKKHGAVFLE